MKITKAYFYKIVYVAILQRGYKVRSGPYRLRIRMFALRTLIGTYEQFKEKIFYTMTIIIVLEFLGQSLGWLYNLSFETKSEEMLLFSTKLHS